jgi:AraC-like DNA-binding protein
MESPKQRRGTIALPRENLLDAWVCGLGYGDQVAAWSELAGALLIGGNTGKRCAGIAIRGEPMMSGPAAGSRPLHFSTDLLPEADRIGVWREVYGKMILRLDIEPLPDRLFKADIRLRALPGLDVVSGVIQGVRDRRTRALIADGNDHVGLAMHWGGVATAEQCGREATLHDGDAVLLSCGDVAAMTRPLPCRYVGVRIPHAALASVVPHIEDLTAIPIRRGTPALWLLQSYVTSLLSDDDAFVGPALPHLAVNHISDLLALMLGAVGDGAAAAEGRGVSAARLRAIKDDVTRHLGSRTLTIDGLASRHRVTPRYIQRLFENEGTSFTEFVLGQRLARAHRLLSDPRQVERTISSIAFEVGFGDLSYFNRVFRRRFGDMPSNVREAARQARN